MFLQSLGKGFRDVLRMKTESDIRFEYSQNHCKENLVVNRCGNTGVGTPYMAYGVPTPVWLFVRDFEAGLTTLA